MSSTPHLPTILGLDIGGANLKAAHTNRSARSVPFALWKNSAGLAAALEQLIASMPTRELLAITMTGELCDCYASRREGVHAILDGIAHAVGDAPVLIWSNQGRFLSVAEAHLNPLAVASANWLALAIWAGRLVPDTEAILIDMGTTTTDLVPLSRGRPIPRGRTDAQRLKSGELLYMGWRRTPVAALLDFKDRLAAELFATTHDVHLLLGNVIENEADSDTADGRPATRDHAHCRLARMLGEDGDTVSPGDTTDLARRVLQTMESHLRGAIHQVSESFRPGDGPQRQFGYVLAGSGERIVPELIGELALVPTISVAERLGPGISQAACAYAVAVLARGEDQLSCGASSEEKE